MCDTILHNIQELIFVSDIERCRDKLLMLSNIVGQKLSTIDGYNEILEHVCRDTMEVTRLQEVIKKMISKEIDDSQKAYELIVNYLGDQS